MWIYRRLKNLLFLSVIIFILIYFGVFTHLREVNFTTSFHYPYDGEIGEFIEQMRANVTPKVAPINNYYFNFKSDSSHKCKNVEHLRMVYLVKSSPENWERRLAIRSSWGFERRFSDVEIRTIFLLGERPEEALQKKIELEMREYSDVVQGNFTDSYYNNTLKAMLGFTWIKRFCSNARFYMFVDDDYYVSTKNLLRFLRNPVQYPLYLKKLKERGLHSLHFAEFDLENDVRLYAGYAFNSAPLRHWSSKWYVSLNEYPYDMWPPYVTAGAYVLSREAFFDMYFAMFYTKHFRFDDIYVALLAFKAKIEPFHSDEFYFKKLEYSPKGYEYVVASHGWEDSREMLKAWTQQRSLGHA